AANYEDSLALVSQLIVVGYGLSHDCLVLFFFSSRRRHTIFSRDWSSDVCSSDLDEHVAGRGIRGMSTPVHTARAAWKLNRRLRRSEERRVGKEYKYGRGWNL